MAHSRDNRRSLATRVSLRFAMSMGSSSLTFQKAGYASTTLHVNVGIAQQINAEMVPLDASPWTSVATGGPGSSHPRSVARSSAPRRSQPSISSSTGASVSTVGRIEITLSGGGLVTPAHFGGIIQGTAVSATIRRRAGTALLHGVHPAASDPEPVTGRALPHGGRQRVGHTATRNPFAGTLSGTYALMSGAPRPDDCIGACTGPQTPGAVLAIVDHSATPGADALSPPTCAPLVPGPNIHHGSLVQAVHADP